MSPLLRMRSSYVGSIFEALFRTCQKSVPILLDRVVAEIDSAMQLDRFASNAAGVFQ